MTVNLNGGVPAGKAQEYRQWIDSEENYNTALKGGKPENFSVFQFERSKAGSTVPEQIKTYFSQMESFASGVIDTADAGEKDGKLDFNEYVKLASGGAYDAKSLKAAAEAMAKYDTQNGNGENKPDGLFNMQEFAAYVKDKYGADINNLDFETFDKYAQEAGMLGTQAGLHNLFSQNFTNTAKLDGDASSIGSKEFAAFLMTHDIDWNELGKNNKKVLDVIDGSLDYMTSQTFLADPASQRYASDAEYLTALYNDITKTLNQGN